MSRKMSLKSNRNSINSTQHEEYPLLKNNLHSAEVVSYQSESEHLVNVAAATKSKLKSNQSSILNSEEYSSNEHGDQRLAKHVSYNASMPTGAAAKPEAVESNQSSMQRGVYSQLSEHGDQQLTKPEAVESNQSSIQHGEYSQLSEQANVAVEEPAATEHVSGRSQPRIRRSLCKWAKFVCILLTLTQKVVIAVMQVLCVYS